jgi:hypothetical protein
MFIDYTKRVIKEQQKYDFKQSTYRGTGRNMYKSHKCKSKLHKCYCKFSACKRHCIKATNIYYADARCNKVRIITLSPRKHYNNEYWVQTPEAWEAVRQVIDYIKKSLKLKKSPVERICINFGYWQSQAGSNGLKPEDCHAHINIVLTLEAINACKE